MKFVNDLIITVIRALPPDTKKNHKRLKNDFLTCSNQQSAITAQGNALCDIHIINRYLTTLEIVIIQCSTICFYDINSSNFQI